MAIGDPKIWANQLRELDVQFLQCVIGVWRRCLDVLPDQPEEDDITFNLVDILWKDANVRRLFHYLEYQYEPPSYTAGGTAYRKGKIDMALILDENRERYLAYECKRLNVVYPNQRKSFATPYITEGLMRFVTQQYAENLPIGCMLGYVLDGNTPDAKDKLFKAINTKKRCIALTVGPQDELPLDIIERFSSRHNRAGNKQEIEIRHALLPFPKDWHKKSTII